MICDTSNLLKDISMTNEISTNNRAYMPILKALKYFYTVSAISNSTFSCILKELQNVRLNTYALCLLSYTQPLEAYHSFDLLKVVFERHVSFSFEETSK